MAYYKVLITEKFVYELLVRANDEADAIKQANTFDGSWGEPIHTSTDTYDVTELEIKNVG